MKKAKEKEKGASKHSYLNRRKLRLETEKTRLEIKNLKSKSEKWLRFIPVLTALIAVVGIWLSVKQFNSQQADEHRWRKAEFIRATIKAFDSNPCVQNTKLMLDSLVLYPEGRMIKLFHEEPETSRQYMKVTPDDIFNALAIDKDRMESEETQAKWIAIADCFDVFLSNLEQLDIDIKSELLTEEDIKPDLIYWIGLMADEKNQLNKPGLRQRLWAYVDRYKFDGVRSLMKRYGYNP